MANENIMICYGADPATSTYNFTGDNPNIIDCVTNVNGHALTNQNADFPIANVQKHDINATWRSTYYGVTNFPNEYSDSNRPWGYAAYQDATHANFWSIINWDLGAADQIDVFAIISHNFETMYGYAGSVLNPTTGLHIQLDAANAVDAYGYPTGGTKVGWDLSEHYNRDPLVFRPGYSRRYWSLYMRIGNVDITPVLTAAKDPYIIGRIVLNSQDMCWTPTNNFDQNYGTRLIDPSVVYENQGQARRVIEKDVYKVWSIPFEASPLSSSDLDTLDTVYRRQGSRRPVFVIKDPHNVAVGQSGEEPATADPSYHCLYGYFSPDTDWSSMVNEYGQATLEFTEQVG